MTPENVDASPSSWFYANSITRTETDAKGEETEREIPYMKGYTVFNAAQCEDCPRITPPRRSPLATPQSSPIPSMEKRPRTKNRGRP